MSQTTTPSGAQLLGILQAMANSASLARWRERTTEDSLTLLKADEYDSVAVSAVSYLIARNAELVELRAALVAEVLTADAKADALAAENKALREDAERYRWLRDVSVPLHNFYISVPVEFTDVRYTPAEVDKAIDEAIAAIARTPAKGDAS